MNLLEINPLVLAYLGDSVYENYVREYLVRKNIPNIKSLQRESLNYVKAKEQADFLLKLEEEFFFKESEMDIIRRARNTKGHQSPKGCDIITYKRATALEAIVGYLYLNNEKERLDLLMKKILEG